MNVRRAFVCGVAGGGVMTLFMAIGRGSGVPFVLELILGAACDGHPGTTEWALGLALPLLVSGMIGVVYGACFAMLTQRAGWRLGIAFSVAHTLLEWCAVSFGSWMHAPPLDLRRSLTPADSAFLGFALVATSKSAGGRPSRKSRMPPPTRWASKPRWRSRRQIPSTSSGI